MKVAFQLAMPVASFALAIAPAVAVVICPTGGLHFLGWFEGARIAEWFAAHGFAAFVLKYRVVPTASDPAQFEQESARFFREFSQAIAMNKRPRSLEEMLPDAASTHVRKLAQADARQAVNYVRSHAAEWEISPDRIGMLGVSAGAFLVTDVIMANDSASRLDFAVLISGGETDQRQIPTTAPPLFIAVAQDDRWMSGLEVAVFTKWDHAGLPVEFHYFGRGGHGFEIDPSNPWMSLLGRWLASRHLMGTFHE